MSEPKYIDADEFVKEKREWYCEQCLKRKGMKRGKLQFVYEIGDVPCRACDVGDVISDIEDFPAADVEPVRHGRWEYDSDNIPHCSECGTIALQRHKLYLEEKIYDVPFVLSKRCPECGAKMDNEKYDV